MKNILIVDDHPIFLQGVKTIIDASPLDVIVSTATDIATTKKQLEHQQPDLLLLDLMLPDAKGFDGLQELVTHYPLLTIAILSSSEDTIHIQTAIKYGVKGYIFKTIDFDEILVAIEKMLSGGCYLPLLEVVNSTQKYKLTTRQSEILHLVSQGLSNKRIAESLYISENTVKKHLNSIFKILKVKNRIQATQCLSILN
jgi:DNA-binding NarL/FixJ family response regulator